MSDYSSESAGSEYLSEGSNSSGEDHDDYNSQLAQVPFEKILHLNNRMQSQSAPADKPVNNNRPNYRQHNQKAVDIKKRENKNHPMEMSSKRPVSRRRTILSLKEVGAYEPRDPRFDSLIVGSDATVNGTSSAVMGSGGDKRYAFLEEYQQSELADMKKRIDKERDMDAKKRMQFDYSRLKSKLDNAKKRKRESALVQDWKHREMELVKQGKRPFFLKESMKRKMFLVDKYQQVVTQQQPDASQNGKSKSNNVDKKLDKFLEKHRKKASSKDAKRLPFKSRQSYGGARE